MAKRTRRIHHTDSEAALYGFRWGPLDVVRNMEYRGTRSLSVMTDHHDLQVGVSPKGHSIRAWLNHVELVDPEPLQEEIARLRARISELERRGHGRP